MIDPRLWLSPEARFICAVAASASVDGEIVVPRTLDWNAFAAALRHHRLEQSIGRRIVNIAGLPEPVRAQLQQRIKASTLRTMEQLFTTIRAVAALEQAGIETLVLKGGVLSRQLYGDPFRRSSVDVDLLVRPQERGAAVAVLQDLGYHAAYPVPAWVDDGAEIALVARGGGCAIDLHVRLAHAEAQCPLRVLRPFDNAAEVMVGRTCLRTLAPAAGLTYLALHATRHYCRSLGWLYDIAVAGQTWRENWPDAVEMAERVGAVGRLRLTALLAHQFFAAPLPDDMRTGRRLATAARALPPLAPALSGSLPTDDLETLRRVGLWRSLWWNLQLADTFSARVGVIGQRLRPRMVDIGEGRRFPGDFLFYTGRKLLRIVGRGWRAD